ncbi:restriction endonuclease subunit S [Nitrospira sp. CMX1]
MSKRLRDVAEVHYGRSPNEVLTEDSPIPIIGTGGIYGRASRAMYNGPAVVVPRKGSLGNPQYVDEPFWPVDTTYAVIPKTGIDAKWLYYSLDTFDLTKLNEATGVPSISCDWLYKVPVGSGEYGEQHRIAEILSTVDEAIEQTEALIAKYQRIKTGLMQDLFTRGVTPDGQLRPTRAKAPHLYREYHCGWIPKEWDMVAVKDCGSVQLGRQRSPDQMSGRWTMPYLRVANVFDGYIDYGDVLEMDFTPDERRTFSLKQGDILLNEGQSLELVGRCALYNGQDDAFCFQNTLVRFRPFDKQCPFFYRFLFKWFLDCGLFMRIAKQTTSVAHLGADRFARMRCVSVPYVEQLRIAERLEVLQSRLNTDIAFASKLRQQKHGLMHDLLTGRVRVKVGEPEKGVV